MLNIKMVRARDLRRRRRPKQLGLSARAQWGGYRAGAGRPRGRSDHYVPHIKRPRITKHKAVHVTLRRVDGLASLRCPRARNRIERIFARENRKGFRLAHYAIRSNHLHLVCEGIHATALSRGIQRIASLVARRLNKLFKRSGRFFRDRFHGRVIERPRDMRNVLRYVLLNEHKDAAKRGERVVGIDPYTSGRWFDGWARYKKRGPPPGAPVVPAQSWLLSRGWRRCGLIRGDELSLR